MFNFLISFLFSFILGVIKYDTTHIQSTLYRIKDKKVKKKLKICVLSDLHGVRYEEDRLYKSIVAGRPDIIIMAGDMANAKFRFSDSSAIDLVRRLANKFPVYYGIGNHEARLKWSPEKFKVKYSRLMSSLRKNGATVLDNESVFLADYGITITGLNLSEEYYGKIFKKETNDLSLSEFIADKSKGFEILIAHNPEYFEDYVRRESDLILSGHLHGGIMRLPFNYGAISPRYALFPKYAYGLYRKKNSRMVVSRGLGQHTIPVRIFNTAEVVFIEIN